MGLKIDTKWIARNRAAIDAICDAVENGADDRRIHNIDGKRIWIYECGTWDFMQPDDTPAVMRARERVHRIGEGFSRVLRG